MVLKSAYEVYAWCYLKADHHTLRKKTFIYYTFLMYIWYGFRLRVFFSVRYPHFVSWYSPPLLSFPFYQVTIFRFPFLPFFFLPFLHPVTCWPPKFKAILSLCCHQPDTASCSPTPPLRCLSQDVVASQTDVLPASFISFQMSIILY